MPGKRLRGRRVNGVGEAGGIGPRDVKGNLDTGLDEVLELGFKGGDGVGAAGLEELRAKFGQGVGGVEAVLFAGAQVVAGVIGGVAAEAEGVDLDEHGAGFGADLLDHAGDLGGEGEGIGRVEFAALDAVAGGALPELGVGRDLFVDRGGVGVAVVLDQENDREGEDGGEVEALVDVAGAGAAVAEEGEADRGDAVATLGIGAAEDVGEHGPEMADHRVGAVGGVAPVDVALAGLGGAAGVGEILVEVVAEVSAPDQVSAEVAVSEGDDVARFVGEKREGDDEALVALAAGDGALDQALTKEVEDAIVGRATVEHPRIEPQQGVVRAELGGREVALSEDGRSGWKCHV